MHRILFVEHKGCSNLSHLNDGDDAAEDADEAEELVGVVVAHRVLQPHERDAGEEGAGQGHHVADQAVATCEKNNLLTFEKD